MASPSESRNMTSEEAEVTSEHRQRESREELYLEFPLVRQSSIYSLTLDEIQNTVCEPGKTFGSMNMDEFLTNIWNVEEGQASAVAAAATSEAPPANVTNCGGAPTAPLRRQGSLTLPSPLCKMTVDEVWADIHRNGELQPQIQRHHENTGNAPRQQTFGEMTLEDFLIKAGVVREGYAGGPTMPSPHPPPPVPPSPAALVQPYSMAGFQMPGAEASGFGHFVAVEGFGDHHQGMGATSMANGVAFPVGSGHGGSDRTANGYGSVTAGDPVGMMCTSPLSPTSPEGLGRGQVDNSAAYGVDGAKTVRGGRKRPADDGTVEKVVERRQRRMIKNRESAARSRARKQAYTVELEAELNQLKEENARLKEEQRRILALRKQLLLESMTKQSQTNVRKTAEMLRRCNTAPW